MDLRKWERLRPVRPWRFFGLGLGPYFGLGLHLGLGLYLGLGLGRCLELGCGVGLGRCRGLCLGYWLGHWLGHWLGLLWRTCCFGLGRRLGRGWEERAGRCL